MKWEWTEKAEVPWTMQPKDEGRLAAWPAKPGKRAGTGRKQERDWVPRQEGNGKRSGSVLEDDLLAVRTLVMGDVTPHVDPADPVLSALLVVPSAGPATSCRTPCGLQEGRVWAPGSLIDQDVQGLLKDPGLWELHLQNASSPKPPRSGPATQPPRPQLLLPSHTSPHLCRPRFSGLDCPLCNFFTQQSHASTSRSSSESGRDLFSLLCYQVSWPFLSLGECFLRGCTVPAVLGLKDTAMNKMDQVPIHREFTI